jgi:hypothetical protein
MAERLDRSLPALKIAVIVMGVLIVLAFAVVAVEITRRLTRPEAGGAPAGGSVTVQVPQGCMPAEVTALGDRLAVRLEPAALCPDLILLDAAGREVGRVEFAPAP